MSFLDIADTAFDNDSQEQAIDALTAWLYTIEQRLAEKQSTGDNNDGGDDLPPGPSEWRGSISRLAALRTSAPEDYYALLHRAARQFLRNYRYLLVTTKTS